MAVPAGERDPRFANADLLPGGDAEFRWRVRDFSAVWLCTGWGVSFTLVARPLLGVGMSWTQILLVCVIAQAVVLLPMLLIEHAGSRHGVPFPVLARASFGLRGAKVPSLLRALSACVWFAFQTKLGGDGVNVLLVMLVDLEGDSVRWGETPQYGEWAGYVIFLVVQLLVVWRGPNALRRFADLIAPLLVAGMAGVLVWTVSRPDRTGLLSLESTLGWGADFWSAVFPALAGTIALYAALSLTIPDITHLGSGGDGRRTWRASVTLVAMMTLSLLYSLVVANSLGEDPRLSGVAPLPVAALQDLPFGVGIGAALVVLAMVCTNLAANLVSAAYDLASVAPRLVGFRGGATLAALGGAFVLWWTTGSDLEFQLIIWADLVEGFFGTVAGIVIADYWLLRRGRLDLPDLYRPGGGYWYVAGWNWRALVAFLVGGVLAVGGSHAETGQLGLDEPLVPLLAPLDAYGWAVGLAASFTAYALLALPDRPGEADGQREPLSTSPA